MPVRLTGDDVTIPCTNKKSPVPPTTGWSEGFILCVPPTIEIEPVYFFKRKVILAMEMLLNPSRPEVMDAPSAIPTILEDLLAVTVIGSSKANKVPKGVVVWLTPGPVTPFTMMYPVLFIVSCWKRAKWRDLSPWWWWWWWWWCWELEVGFNEMKATSRIARTLSWKETAMAEFKVFVNVEEKITGTNLCLIRGVLYKPFRMTCDKQLRPSLV